MVKRMKIVEWKKLFSIEFIAFPNWGLGRRWLKLLARRRSGIWEGDG